MQIGEKFSAPAVSGATLTDAMPLDARLAAQVATLPAASVHRTREASTVRALALPHGGRPPLRESMLSRDLPSRRSNARDGEQEAMDTASPAAVWFMWQPPLLPDATEREPRAGTSLADDADAEAATVVVATVEGRETTDGVHDNASPALVADESALHVSVSRSARSHRGAAGASDTPVDNVAATAPPLTAAAAMTPDATRWNSSTPPEPPRTPNPSKTSDRATALNPSKASDSATTLTSRTTSDRATMSPRRPSSSTPPAISRTIVDADADADAMTDAVASMLMTDRRSNNVAGRAHLPIDRNDATVYPPSPVEREGARQPIDGAVQQEMPVGSANDVPQRGLYPMPSPEGVPTPTAASSPDPLPRQHPQADHRPPESSVATPASDDSHATRLSVPFNSWPSQSRVELSLSANDPGMPSIRMLPSTDGVRQALEQAWPTASADWSLDARDDSMPDRRHSRAPEQDDDDEDKP